MRILGRYPATLVATLFGMALLAAAFIGNINVFDMRIPGLDHIQRNEVDELAIAFLLVIGGILVDLIWRRQIRRRGAEIWAQLYEAEMRAQTSRVVDATMQRADVIMDDFLRGVRRLHLDSEVRMPQHSSKALEALIKDATGRLKALRILESDSKTEASLSHEFMSTFAPTHESSKSR
jgi:hypothetical protein